AAAAQRSCHSSQQDVMTSRGLVLGVLLGAALMAVAAPPCAAWQGTITDEQAVESGRNALRGSFPWYDAQTDDVRRVDVRPDKSADNLNRQSQWEPRPPQPPTVPNWNLGWLSSLFSGIARLLPWFLVIVGIALAGLLIW